VLEKISDEQYRIKDLGSKNGVQINGKSERECLLKTGDIIQVGNVVFKFSLAPAEKKNLRLKSQEKAPSSSKASASLLAKFKNLEPQKRKRILIYGAVAIGLLGLLMLTGEEPKKEVEKKSNFQFSEVNSNGQNALATAGNNSSNSSDTTPNKTKALEDPLLKNAEQDLEKLDWSNSPLKGAEFYFRKGQREYLNKNYHRAIEYFQTALSIYRGHTLAQTYLRYAIYEVENEAKKNFEVGVKYFESLQYTRAIYHFNEVVNLMIHRASDPIVTQAEKYIDLSRKKLEVKEIFP
jgi:tetratricopeptide (TPR) repeat protein